MFRFFRKNREQKNDVNELMNEVGKELGVDEDTRSINETPKKFAERMKKEIQKRT
jgi:GTP cyclohydrolase I